MTFTPDDEPEFVPPPYASDDDTSLIDGNHEDDGLTTFTVSVDPSQIPFVEVDPTIDRVGYGPIEKSAWAKFASWAVVYPVALGLIWDVYLFLRGGYKATITASTRLIFRIHPWTTAFPTGFVVGGLTCHFFFSFAGWWLSREAIKAFATGLPSGFTFVYFFFYG